MFGKDADNMCLLLSGCKKTGDFLELLDLYNPDGANTLAKIREEQVKNRGIV